MGILNVTPDSFSDGGDYIDCARAVEHAKEMAAEGAAIIDVGGESTRPGAASITPDEEWARIGAVVEQLAGLGLCVSVDTRHFEVAQKALSAGASIINDVSGFRDPKMIDVVKGSECGLIVMHMQGEPQNMQIAPHYDDVVGDVASYLRERASQLEKAGIAHSRICIDPGPGFGKTAQQTVELMRNIHEFRHLGYPVCAAVSRKSYIAYAYKIESDDPKDRDEASAQEALLACEMGASIIRTHNVKAALKALEGFRPYVVLGLGSNVALVAEEGEETEAKIAQINMAVGSLCQLPDSELIDMSSFYESEPAYDEDQDSFVNAVVLMRTGIPPLELLDYIHAIENMLGRVHDPERRYGPRAIDIDIVDYQLYTAISDKLTLPHPKAIERDFVVKPFIEILPNHILADGTKIDVLPESKRIGRAKKL